MSDILEKIGLDENIPILEVWNKIDLHPECQKMQQPDISLNKRKIYKINSIEYGDIEGSFSIKDTENLNNIIISNSLKSINQKVSGM